MREVLRMKDMVGANRFLTFLFRVRRFVSEIMKTKVF